MRALLVVLALACFVFSLWLMWHTLSYDSAASTILVGGKYWSDFGGHLPQIRSFSFGSNWPPEYPLYPGEPIRYHFLFYALVGLLEKSGLRLDYALNLPSSLGFFCLLLMIFTLAKRLFHRTSVGLLSVVFFLFNGSFSWFDHLKNYHFSLTDSITALSSLSRFPAFGPWNGSSIAAFWNLNIYTNQRHLGLSFALALVVLYLLVARRHLYLVGFLIGLLLFLNLAAAAAAALFAVWFFLTSQAVRRPLVLSVVGFIPWLIASVLLIHPSSALSFQPGFLYPGPFHPLTFMWYLITNFGLHLILIPLGVVLAPKRLKLLALPLLALFLVPFLFRLSTDMINNHKFINFFLIIGAMYSAYALVRIKPLLILFPLLVLGGVVDFFPVKNDHYLTVIDYPKNPDVSFYVYSTPKNSVVLNSTWFYHPASIAGRKIYNGYSYFTWSFGYDQVAREQATLAIYQASSKAEACQLLTRQHINYVELSANPESFLAPSLNLWHTQFIPAYTNPKTHLSVYSVFANCHDS